MGTFEAIGLYSVFVLVGVVVVGGAFTLLGLWLSDQSEEDADH